MRYGDGHCLCALAAGDSGLGIRPLPGEGPEKRDQRTPQTKWLACRRAGDSGARADNAPRRVKARGRTGVTIKDGADELGRECCKWN